MSSKKANPTPNGENGSAAATNSDGRDKAGRFVQGNAGGPGNPHAGHLAKLRAVLLNAATPQRMGKAARAILAKAEKGDVMAFRELCDRIFGKSHQSVEFTGDVTSTHDTQVSLTIDWSRATAEELQTLRLLRERIAGRAADAGSN